MQKPANRILSALLVLVMVLSMLPATVLADGETESALKGWNIILGDDIGVKFTLNSADYTVITTVNGTEVTPTISGETVTVYVAAAQMTDTIGLTVKNGEETVHTGEYSVRQYADTILNGSYDAEVKDMVRQMLNYGAAAQTYFNYNNEEGKLANAGITVGEATVPTEVPAIVVEDNLAGISLYGMSLVFRNKIAVRFYFNVTGNIADFTFSQGTAVEKDGLYYVEVAGINPQDMDKNITLNVNDGALSVTYSPMTYIIRQYNSASSSAELKALVQAMYGYHLEALDYQEYLKIVQIESLSAATQWGSNGVDYNEDGTISNIYATANANDAAYNTDWSVEYSPVAADGIKLVRGGETFNVGIPGSGTLVKFNESDFALKLAAWTISGSKLPLADQDYLIVEGRFSHEASGTTIQITKTYIYNNNGTIEFSATMPVLPTTIDAGVMSKHSVNGWASNGVYGVMAENAAPYDGWSVEYAPVAAENLKLIRNGETYNIGFPGRGTLVKYSATDYFLKMEWNVGEYAPMQDGDILIVEGGFINAASKVTLNIAKTYIYANGANVEFSTEMPNLGSTVEAGVMQTHPEGVMGNGIRFRLDANDAPFSDWSYEYKQTAKSNVKLIRGDETIDIGIVDRPLIVKYGDIDYYLKLEGWTIGEYGWNDQANPITTDDILIIEGAFVHTDTKTTLNITKSYVYYDGSAWVCKATLPVEVDCGVMTENADGTPEEIYFSMSENSVPVDEEIEYPYTGTVQLVTGSNVTSVNAAIYKIAEDQYYLELDTELADQSYLIVEGAFVNGDNGYTMNITRTYVLNDGGSLVFSTTEPVFETEFAVTGLTNHGNGWAANGIYISHNAHSAQSGSWSVEYKPVSAEVIKLVRGGTTYNIGQPASGTLVAYNNTNMFLKTEAWTIQGGVLPFVDGDQIIIEGKFKHEASGNILVVEKTVICVNGSSLIFNPIMAGHMGTHSNGVSGEGIYATMAENAAPYDGWNIEYTPATEDAYYVIRNGEQINIGKPGRGTLVKYSATEYFLKINAWCTDNFAYTTDDIIVIDGFWKQNTDGNAILKIEKTYLYYTGSAWTFSAKLPSVVNAGLMQTHANGMSGNGIYFKLDANAAPYNGWSYEYKQTSVDNIKLIRNGETISIGIAGRPLIIKYAETDYYLKLEGWTVGQYGLNGQSNPITTDDIIIIEGNFEYDNVTLNITKSYVYFDGTAWICSAEAPEQKNVVDVVELGSHTNGWKNGNIYFTAAVNNAPYNTDWSLRYKPVSADVIKLTHNGETKNVGNTDAETIGKYSETEYFIAGWAVGLGNVVAGDVMTIEGQFYHAASDTYIDVEKTTITFCENDVAIVVSESSKYINAGTMSAYTSNWFGDGIYFTLGSNVAPANSDWSVEYKATGSGIIKLIRNGETKDITVVDNSCIVKISDNQYWLKLENWLLGSNAPIQDGDVLVIEGEFRNASNGYTLNIDKTYITFISKENDEVVFSTAADTEFGDVLLPSSNKTLNIGVWNGSYHVFEDKQLRELQAAGITKIMGIDTQWIGTTDVNAWLDRVYSYGISVIFDLRSWDGVTVPSYANHPGVLGFLMYDEPCATDFDELATLKGKFDAVMPADKLFYVNLFPSCAAGTSLVGTIDWALGRRDYDVYYVQKFLDKLDIEVLSWDNYSLLNGNGIRTDYYYNFEVMASKTGVEKWYTMLSSGHGTTSASYATPTAEELRWQMAVALTYGVQNIDHYIYVSHEDDYSCMVENETWEPTALYYDILKVDNEYLAWDNIYMAYNYLGTAGVKAGNSSTMLDKLKNNINLSENGLAVGTNKDVLVGVFENSGNKAYMITNAGSAGSTTVGDGKNFTMEDATVTLTLGEGSYKCVAVIDNGEISYVAVENNTVTLNVEAYEGVFVIPVFN